jgi:hypothetical protein
MLPLAAWWAAALFAVAVLLAFILRARGWGASAFWIALTLAGQASALQLPAVGPNITLQLFAGWSRILRGWQIVPLAFVALQAFIVAIGLWLTWRKNPQFRRCAASLLSLPQAILLLVIAAYASITIAPEVAQAFVRGGFLNKAILHSTKIALGLCILFGGAGSLALAAWHLPRDVWARWTACWENRNRARLPYFAALWVVIVSSVLAWLPLDAMPHIPDEVAYIFQAKYISTGHVYLPAPPSTEAFVCRFTMVDDGRWYSAMLGGWPYVLAIGIKLGVPWLINPLLGGIAILLAHALVRRLYDASLADGVALLLAFSPWLLFMSANFMPHATSLVLFLLGMLGVHSARENGSFAGGALAGFAFGGLLHVRPLEAVAVAGVAGIWWLSAGWKRFRLTALLLALLTGVAMTALFLAYNKVLTGDPLYAPVNKYFDLTTTPGSNRLGFGPDIGNWGSGWRNLDALEGHGPIDVLMNSNQNLYLINFELFGWACGSLLLVWLLFVWGRWRRDALQWGMLLGLFLVLNLYWFSGGPDYGARYWYQMILPCSVLAVRGAQELASRISERAPDVASVEPQSPSRVWAFVLLATLIGAVNVVPWRALDKYPNYRGITSQIRALAAENNFGRALVFIRGPEWPDYHSAFALNPPWIAPPAADAWDAPIFARDLGREANETLRSKYANRAVWFVAGGKHTGDVARLIAGPIPPGQPLPEVGYVPPGKAVKSDDAEKHE